MKLGTENRTKTIAALALAVVAVLAAVWAFNRPAQPAAASAPPGTVAASQGRSQAPRQARGPRRRSAALALVPGTDPRLRLDLLKASEGVTYAGSGRNIFRPDEPAAPIPAPVKNPLLDKTVAEGPPAPPPPPRIPLRFFGFASRQGEPKRIFLADGDDVFVAGEGEIVNRRYKVLHIGGNSVEIQDVLNNNVQTIPLTSG